MKNLNIAFESENIYFVYLSKTLINEYLKMYNNQAIQKKLFK